jgi:hypothetical protein
LPELKRQKLALADNSLELVKFAGDCVVAAFFLGDKDSARNLERNRLLERFTRFVTKSDVNAAPNDAVETLRTGQHPVFPFHWEIEFPEVFDRENFGFDAIVGNPPFLGGTRISEVAGMGYFQWLVTRFPPCEHHCDMVAYFFRRGFVLLRRGGTQGLIATNTIAQGDTREGGLAIILKEEGQIYAATRRQKWPGQVSVIVSVIHIGKGTSSSNCLLDGKKVSRISAYLVDGNSDASPSRLTANPYFSLGCKIYGQGFLFDDSDPNCTPLAQMQMILAKDPNCAARILPYIGGEEVNTHPEHQHERYAIYLCDIETEGALKQWHYLEDIVRAKVKPEREQLGSNPNNIPLKRKWWAYQAHRPDLYLAIKDLSRVLVVSRVRATGFTFLPPRMIFSEQLVVFPLSSYSSFCALQSRPHELWSRFFSSTALDLVRYTPSDCFQTFPFPWEFERSPALEEVGEQYYRFRAALMLKRNEGMTKTYNLFHDPEEKSPDFLQLRALHAAMDRAMLNAYGWTDLNPTCEFLLDYEDEEDDDDENPSKKKRKKPWRCRWPDEIRDEVLARLLKLNAERAEEEKLSGATAVANETGKGKRNAKKEIPRGELFD